MAQRFDEEYNLRIELDTKHCELTEAEVEDVHAGLKTLDKAVEDFPVSDLYITVIRHPRSQDFHVKTALRLPSRTLFTGERHDDDACAAFQRCVRKLIHKVKGYKAELDDKPEYHKEQTGKVHSVIPDREPSVAEIQEARRDGDYAAFRRHMYVYEEAVNKRAGRWIQRYPKAQAILGQDLILADVVEEVFLNAFERFDERPPNMGLGEWLEQLIDDSVRSLLRHPDEEKQNISFARTLSQTDTE